MSTYVVRSKCRSDEATGQGTGRSDHWNTPDWAIFTDHRAASAYLRQLGEDFEIAQLNAMQLLRWMVRIYEQGTHYLDVNPRPDSPAGDGFHARLAIDQQLAHFAELLTREVVACAESSGKDGQVLG